MQGLRIAAWVLIALAIALIGADLISSVEAGQPVVRTVREIVSLLPGVTLGRLAEGGLGGVINLMLDLPLWAVLGVLGLVATILIKPVE
ncbi:hypothetical protein [Parvularcula maris]|uniref:Uncharacterized protein n=1 Tax=Parvularcula maris TaxID=2965077 RepID=A0A9X2LDV2_9PROT|nr:hypothetical protein [Parvularcula maris]MCQ8186652.1 hypothetical protein [Parvularcula maris]